MVQPDGKSRVVSYTANDRQGFVANVSYSDGDGGYVYSNRYAAPTGHGTYSKTPTKPRYDPYHPSPQMSSTLRPPVYGVPTSKPSYKPPPLPRPKYVHSKSYGHPTQPHHRPQSYHPQRPFIPLRPKRPHLPQYR